MGKFAQMFCILSVFVPLVAGEMAIALDDFTGVFLQQSGYRYFGDQEACKHDHGEYNAADGSCVVRNTGTTSSIRIWQNPARSNQYFAHIEAIWGSGHGADFDGVVTKTEASKIIAQEAVFDDSGSLKKVKSNGCIVTITISPNGIASSNPGKRCARGLMINDAQREKTQKGNSQDSDEGNHARDRRVSDSQSKVLTHESGYSTKSQESSYAGSAK